MNSPKATGSRDECSARGPQKGARRADDKKEKVNPAQRRRQDRGQRESEAGGGKDQGGSQNNFLPVMGVREMTGWQREQYHRRHLGQPHKRQRQR